MTNEEGKGGGGGGGGRRLTKWLRKADVAEMLKATEEKEVWRYMLDNTVSHGINHSWWRWIPSAAPTHYICHRYSLSHLLVNGKNTLLLWL